MAQDEAGRLRGERDAARRMAGEQWQERLSIEESLLELKKAYTIILVPHNIQQGSRVADRAAFFLNGDLVEIGTAYQMFTSPKDKRTEDYVTGKFG